MFLLIDNYDSFTYNLYHYLGELGATLVVHRNDKVSVDDVMKARPQGIILSPGPCTPSIRIPSTSAVFDGPVQQITFGSSPSVVMAAARSGRMRSGVTTAMWIHGASAARRVEVVVSSRISEPLAR